MVKKVSQIMRKPVFEVMNYPRDELLWQLAFFSIDENQDTPIIEQKKATSEEASILAFKSVFG